MAFERIIQRPLVTEKTAMAREVGNRYVFAVDRQATKHQIKEAIQSLFNVKVLGVNTMIVRGRYRRYGRGLGKTPNWKKAIVTLDKGNKIDLLEAKA